MDHCSKIDQLLKQMEEADKVRDENVASSDNNDGEAVVDETEEYVSFVLKEIIEGRESIDNQPPAATQPNTIAQEFNQIPRQFNQVGGVAAINQQVQDVAQQPNTNLDVFNFNQSGNPMTVAQPVVATYQVGGQKMVIPLSVVPVAVPSQEPATATVPQPAEPTPGPAPGPSDSKKRKLYELEEFNDPQMEKKRRNAINAKNHRDKTKSKIQKLTEELDVVKVERDSFSVQNELLKTENGQMRTKARQEQFDREALLREVIALREENARLRQQENSVVQHQQEEQQSIGLQQEKIGMLDLFDLLSDDHYGC